MAATSAGSLHGPPTMAYRPHASVPAGRKEGRPAGTDWRRRVRQGKPSPRTPAAVAALNR